jgi:hypothetical protein
MKTLYKIFASIVLALTLNLVAHAKEWHGITPLHSIRADVERILGQPSRLTSKALSVYYLDEGLVQIIYASEGIANAHHCSETIPPDTVLVIYVSPKSKNDLQPDVSGFEEFDPAEGDINFKAYYGKKDGVVIVTHKGRVFSICYMAEAEDKRFCSTYYNPETLVHIHSAY